MARAFQAARDTLQSDPKMLEIIRELKASGKSIFAMSNISAPDWEVLKTKADPSVWALFDMVFISYVLVCQKPGMCYSSLTLRAEAHERKPNVGFYHSVLSRSGIDPKQTIFVDDKLENVLTARSLGVHGIVFDDVDSVVRQLKNLCGNPVDRALSFLRANKKNLVSVTTDGIILHEVLVNIHVSSVHAY